jgi:flagellar motor switch/type III secretory pathway protein FliN
MVELTSEIVGEVIAACRSGADEIVASLSRALDDQFMGVTIGEAATYDSLLPPEGFNGPGLAVVLQFGKVGAVAMLPESSGLLPNWYASPDATGRSQLSTLAQELGMLLMPAALMAEEFHAIRVSKLAGALASSIPAEGAALVPLTLKSGDKQGQMSMIWPLAKPRELLTQSAADHDAEAKTGKNNEQSEAIVDLEGPDFSNLPPYTQSLFKIRVPVSVNLASHKQSVQEIIELVPGSIIRFDKSCDEMLELVVGDQPIAEGEVVKVGDKFGLRVENMILPQERFIAIQTTIAS